MADQTTDESRSFEDMLRQRQERIHQALTQLGVYEGLASDAKPRLVDLVSACVAAHRSRAMFPKASQKWLQLDEKHGTGQRRMFARKVRKALASIEDVLDYVARVGSEPGRNELFSRALAGLAVPNLRDAKTALEAIPLDNNVFLAPTSTRINEAGHALLAESQSESTETLYRFFRESCALSGRESDRRTAVIGNALLGWRVKVDDEWTFESSRGRGASAIRNRRLRGDAKKKSRR
jgi:hypothetical protein